MSQRFLFTGLENGRNRPRSLEELSVVDVGLDFLGDRVKKQKFGPNYKGLCIFHEEKTPSFYLKPKWDFYACYGACKVRGGPVELLFAVASNPADYLMACFGIDFSRKEDASHFEAVVFAERKRLNKVYWGGVARERYQLFFGF